MELKCDAYYFHVFNQKAMRRDIGFLQI